MTVLVIYLSYFNFTLIIGFGKKLLKLGTDVVCEKCLIRKFKDISWTLKPWNWAYSAHGFSWYANLLKSVSNIRFIIEAQFLTNMIVSFRLIYLENSHSWSNERKYLSFFRVKNNFNQIWEDFCHKLGFNKKRIIWNRL